MKRLIFLIIILISAPAYAANYYVDCSAAAGGNGSLATPWDAVADVNAASFSAGDNVYFKRGCTFREQLTVPSSGSSGSPITFGAYGTGAKPIISGADLKTSGDITNETISSTEETGGLFASGLENEVDAFTTDFTGKSESGSATVTVSSADGTFNSGAKGAKFLFDGSALSLKASKTIGDNTTMHVRAYFKLDAGFALQAANGIVNILTITDGGIPASKVYMQCGASPYNDCSLKAFCHPATVIFSGQTINLNQWYSIEINYVKSATVGGSEFWLDGVSKGSNFTLNTTSTPDGFSLGGADASAPANGAKMYYDDVKADTAYIGAVDLPEPSVTNYYYISNATDPKGVWRNGTRLATQATKGAVDSTGKWWFDDPNNRVYLWDDSGNPGTSNTIEVATRNFCIVSANDDYITFDGLECKNTVLAGISLQSGTDYNTISNFYIHHTVQDGIQLAAGSGDVTYTTIQNSEIYSCGTEPTDDDIGGLGNGIMLTGAADGATRVENTTIEHNYIHGNGYVQSAYCHDHGIYDQGYQTTVRRNNIDGNAGFGVKVQNSQSGGTDGGGNQTHYNVIQNNKTGAVVIECSHITTDGTNTKSSPVNNKVWNNVIYNNGRADVSSSYYAGLAYSYYEGTPTGNEFKNNIVYVDHVAANKIYMFLASNSSDSLTGITFDNNIYYSSAAQVFRADSENSTSLSQWQGRAYTGDNDNNSISSDPKFRSTTDFHLLGNSPAINAGEDVSLTTDYAGLPIIGLPDIGAYEYRGGGNIMKWFLRR